MGNYIKRIRRKIYKALHPAVGEVLMLHRVTETRSVLEENRQLEVTPVFLEETILKYKAEGYRFVSLDEVHEQMTLKKKQKGKFVCFTLDDGYRDNYELAYPVFKKHNCPFAIYVTTDFPDGKGLLWWYILENILLNEEKLTLSDGTTYHCKSLVEKNEVFRQIRDKVFSVQSDNMQETIQDLLISYPFPLDAEHLMTLNWKQIQDLANEPLCTIASHTVSHPALTKLPDDRIRKELLESKAKLEEAIKVPVNHFAYPYGDYDDRVVALVRQSGYKTAALANGGLVREGEKAIRLKRNTLTEK